VLADGASFLPAIVIVMVGHGGLGGSLIGSGLTVIVGHVGGSLIGAGVVVVVAGTESRRKQVMHRFSGNGWQTTHTPPAGVV
jgi:hypothetical protein